MCEGRWQCIAMQLTDAIFLLAGCNFYVMLSATLVPFGPLVLCWHGQGEDGEERVDIRQHGRLSAVKVNSRYSCSSEFTLFHLQNEIIRLANAVCTRIASLVTSQFVNEFHEILRHSHVIGMF